MGSAVYNFLNTLMFMNEKDRRKFTTWNFPLHITSSVILSGAWYFLSLLGDLCDSAVIFSKMLCVDLSTHQTAVVGEIYQELTAVEQYTSGSFLKLVSGHLLNEK